MNTTNWLPGVIVTVIGALTAVILLLTSKRRTDSGFASDQNDLLADHDRRFQELLEELRELDQDQHHLPPDAFAVEKARLEKEAASALRARDEFARKMGAPAVARKAEGQAPAFSPGLKAAVWITGTVLFFAILGVVLTQEQKPREDMPNGKPGPMTGGGAPSQAELDAAKKEEDEFNKLMERLKANPDDVELLAAAGHQMMRAQKFTDAAALTEKALTLDPFHTESRIHKAVLRGLRGDTRPALDELEVIGNTHPDGAEALLFAGALAMEINDARRALTAFEKYAATAPPEERPPGLMQGIAMLRQQLQNEGTPQKQQPTGSNTPPPLTEEQIKAFEQMQKSPEFQAQAQTNIEAAEKDLAAGRFQDALDKYKSVMPVLPESGRAKAGMAYALIGLNKQPMADRVWGVAVQSDPAAVDALGDQLQKLGDTQGAKSIWGRLSQSAPGYAGIDRVKQKLQ